MRLDIIKKVVKGAWRMPWLMEAMKDVISCDKSSKGRMADALAHGGDEGRDKLR